MMGLYKCSTYPNHFYVTLTLRLDTPMIRGGKGASYSFGITPQIWRFRHKS